MTFKKWTTTDESDLETVVQELDEFVTKLEDYVKGYLKHAFLTKTQSNFYNKSKDSFRRLKFWLFWI
jgi:hypothetical protein